MKTVFLIVTLLHTILASIELSNWQMPEDERKYEPSLKEDQPSSIVVVIVQNAYNPETDMGYKITPENLPHKKISRAHIRDIHDIRHDPAFSARHYMKRRLQRCHIRRRLCVYGECAEYDIECIHECRVRFNACYRMPTFDDQFPAYPEESPVTAVKSDDITFDSIMQLHGQV